MYRWRDFANLVTCVMRVDSIMAMSPDFGDLRIPSRSVYTQGAHKMIIKLYSLIKDIFG